MQAKLKIEQARTKDLVPYANNAKIHTDEQVEQICASIEEFGFNDPIAVWTNPAGELEIIEGHGRLMAANRMGIDTVPIIKLDHLDDEARRAYTHVHNKLTMNTGFDWATLEEELANLDYDFALFGFDVYTGEPEPSDVVEVEVPEETPERTKRGDIWQLGDHVLMCGDAADPADMDALFKHGEPMMVFTDPPYGVAIGSKNKTINEVSGKGGRIEEDIEGDTLGPGELRKLLATCMRNLRERCSDNCSYYVSAPQGGDLGTMMLLMMEDAGLPVRHNLVWVKSSACFSMGRLDYDYRHEPIYYTWGRSHRFTGGYDTTVFDDNKPLEKLTKAELKDLVHSLRDAQTSVIYCDKPMSNDLHPTMKPVKLIARFVYNSSLPGETVADIFGGSGSTLMAAEQLERRCLTMEIDPHYCDVIIGRWEKFTGKKAVKIG